MHYFDKYNKLFPIRKFPLNYVPPHIFYYIHPGAQMSTDVDIAVTKKAMAALFFKDNELVLNQMTAEQLEKAVNQYHTLTVAKSGNDYRKLVIFVKKSSPPADIISYFSDKYKNDARLPQIITVLQKYTINGKRIGKDLIIRIASSEDQSFNKLLAQEVLSKISSAKIIEMAGESISTQTLTIDLLGKYFKDNLQFKIKAIAALPDDEKYQQLFAAGKEYLETKRDVCEAFPEMLANETSALITDLPEEERITLINLLSEFQFIPELPRNIPEAMKLFYATLSQSLRDGDPFETASYVCRQYVKIHPKSNGNGRVSRDIAKLILLQAGIIPPVFKSDDEYMTVLRKSDDLPSVFTEYLFKCSCEMADLYFNQTQLYENQYPAFSEADLNKFKAYAQERERRSKLGLINTSGSERRDYNPQNVLNAKSMDDLFENTANVFSILDALQKLASVNISESSSSSSKSAYREIPQRVKNESANAAQFANTTDYKKLEEIAKKYSADHDYDKAIMCYHQAIVFRQQNNPDNKLAIAADNYNIAMCYSNQGKKKEAIKFAELALNELPTHQSKFGETLKGNIKTLMSACEIVKQEPTKTKSI